MQAEKFFPPQVDVARLFFRERLRTILLRQVDRTRPHILLEARAGQGKTLLLHQLFTSLGLGSMWLRICPEDGGPERFARDLEKCLASRIPASSCSLRTGRDIPDSLASLLRQAESLTREDVYLVLDDAHHLLPHTESLHLLRHLSQHAPKWLHFALASRGPLPEELLEPGRGGLLRLGNQDLALNEDEIVDFVRHEWGLTISKPTAQRLLRDTEGWIRGVRILGQTLARGGRLAYPSAPSEVADRDELLLFFRHEILHPMGAGCRRALLRCALLDAVPLELATRFGGDEAISCLGDLARRGAFVRESNAERSCFTLHPLFRQALRDLARAELPEPEIREIFALAAQNSEGRNEMARALGLLVQAGNGEMIESFLQRHGVALVAANQSPLLADQLGRIPHGDLCRQGWSQFFLALASLDSRPQAALPLLLRAREVFTQRQDRVGELLCLAHVISIHIMTTGHYREGEDLLHRTSRLFFEVADDLDAEKTILVARSLAMGHCIFLADIDEATRFASLAMGLARKNNLVNFEAALLMISGYIHIFAGHTAVARAFLEQAFVLARHPDVGPFNSLGIRMMLFNFLFHEGDFFNYFDQKNQLIETLGSPMVAQSIAGPFCCVWEMDIAINQGLFTQALDIAAQAQALHEPLSPHLLSQVLQFKALVMALQGDEGAVDMALESLRLRDLSGGRYFIALNRIIVGQVLAVCGRDQQGLAMIDEGIAWACQMPTAYLEACGRLHRAEALLRLGRPGEAGRDIGLGLGLMRRNAYRHAWGWPPEARRAVLRLAVTERIEADYARKLAPQLLDSDVLDDGTVVPRLEFRTLGGLRVLLQSRPLLGAEDLTPAQRELLGMLLSSPGLKVSIDAVQVHLWPDSPAETFRIKCDTLVSRLRKTLAEALPEAVAQSYLCRGKGLLWLEHCRVDAQDFTRVSAQGCRHLQLQELWQAGNAFAEAESLWAGEFLPEVAGNDHLRAHRESLTTAFSALACAWSDLLHSTGQEARAVRILERALYTDPFNEKLHRSLYLIKGQSSALGARQVLRRFAAQLRQEGYSGRDIDGVLAGISSSIRD